MNPVKMLLSNGNLPTAGSNDAPAEPLLCGERLQPVEVFAERGHRHMQHTIHWTRDSFLPLQGLDFWDYLPLNHPQNQLLELIMLV